MIAGTRLRDINLLTQSGSQYLHIEIKRNTFAKRLRDCE